jgi:GT2 family glycosyltransferase
MLVKSVESFLGQDYPKKDYEILVIDDGSTDDTADFLKKYSNQPRYIYQENKGPAAARNNGIKNSKGEIILFVNDDTIAPPDLLKKHLAWHRKYPEENVGVLGFVTWHKELRVSSFMHWLEHSGLQFDYDKIKGIDASWQRFWACNVSFKRDFLVKCGLFDEEFPCAVWEDIELGYRLSKQGLRLLYNKDAVAYHYHPSTIKSAKNKMLLRGKYSLLLGKKIPLKYAPRLASPLKRRFMLILDTVFLPKPVFFLIERLANWAEERIPLSFIFNIAMIHYRIKGSAEFQKI